MLRFAPSRILRAASQQAPVKADWGKTLNLPRSGFPARPTAVQLETYRQQCADDLYAWQRASRSKSAVHNGAAVDNEFVLHDGPPYANGAVHAGHALNKILKDIIVRSQLGRGKLVRYQPGWDCHGLPIELKALQARGDAVEQSKAQKEAGVGIPPAEIRQTASSLASKTIDEQRKEFRGWGVMGEWDAPYKTMDREFEIRQLGVFREMVKKGLIFRDHRPVYWSPSSRTALAEAELEYNDAHECTAAFVKLPFVRLPEPLRRHDAVRAEHISALIWTTTPWTLPANKAIAFNKHIDYVVIRTVHPDVQRGSHDQLLLAKDRIEHVLSFLPEGTSVEIIVDNIPGTDLVSDDAVCFNIFQRQTSRFVAADFVTATSGTGLVHMAPGHGMEDYQVCQRYGLTPAFAPVDEKGCFTADVFPAAKDPAQLQGLFAEKKGAKAVLDILTNPSEHVADARSSEPLLLAAHKFVHKNPIDWRTKQPVITRATAQWFADVSLIKDRALAAIEDVKFVPESGRSRLKAFIEGRSQWCISRQRAWGVPIPALYHKETGEACITDESIGHIISVIEAKGTDAWFSDPEDDPAWLHPSLQSGNWIRGKDTMDVWFDSGTTWTSLTPRHSNQALADVYVEGSDQHRGWFQSSLLTAVATQDPAAKPKAPYDTLLTHGFILDGEGRKMSKSLGNVISPAEIVSGSLLQQPQQQKKKGKNVANAGKEGKVPVAGPVKSSKKKQDSLGPDLLRLWVASSDYTRDVPISQQGLLGVQQALQKYRVTLKFLCGVMQDYSQSSTDITQMENLPFKHKAVLLRLEQRSEAIFAAFQHYKFHEGVREINTFVNADLSAFYLEVVKDPLYAGTMCERREAQQVLAVIMKEMLHWLAPLTPHLVQEARSYLPEDADWVDAQVLQQTWAQPFSSGFDPASLEEPLKLFGEISRAVKLAQEQARAAGKLGSGLACRVNIVSAPDSNLLSLVSPPTADELPSLLVVSEVAWDTTVSPLAIENVTEGEHWRVESLVELLGSEKPVAKVQVLPPQKEKCVRCWNYVAEDKETPCSRCREALGEKGVEV